MQQMRQTATSRSGGEAEILHTFYWSRSFSQHPHGGMTLRATPYLPVAAQASLAVENYPAKETKGMIIQVCMIGLTSITGLGLPQPPVREQWVIDGHCNASDYYPITDPSQCMGKALDFCGRDVNPDSPRADTAV